MNHLLLVTGERGAGKTPWVISFAETLREEGICVRGLAMPGVFQDREKVGFDALLLPGKEEQWPLARRGKAARGFPSAAQDGLRIGPWRMSRRGFARGVARINGGRESSFAPGDSTPEVLILDEIGPLELNRGEGFYPLYRQLPRMGAAQVVMVVRPSLVGRVKKDFDRIPSRILQICRKEPPPSYPLEDVRDRLKKRKEG